MVKVGLAPDNASLLIRFAYHPGLVELTKQLPGRRFHRGLGGWLVPLTRELVEELPARYPGVTVEVEEPVKCRLRRLAEDERLTKELKEYKGEVKLPQEMVFPTTQPMSQQKVGLSLFVQRPLFAYLMEMGTGKTFIILGGLAWLKQHQLLRPSLVVAPASVLSVWEDEARKHQPGLKVCVLKGSVTQRVAQLRAGYVAGVEVFVLNYEATWRMEETLLEIPWKCMVLDESTKIKSRTAKQSKTCVKLGKHVPRRYILTGTPIPNSPLELFTQFFFIDPAVLGHQFYAFRDRYAIMGGYQGYQVVSWKNLTELMGKINGHSYRVLKKDCLDLPEKTYTSVRLDLEEDQQVAYKQLAEELVTEVEDKQVTAAVLVTKLMKLREILAGWVKADDGTIKVFKKQAKLDALEDLIEALPPTGKMVIWCIFHEEMRLVSNLLTKLGHANGVGYVMLSGETPMGTRGELVKQFQENPDCRFFVGQQKAGGLGITLTAAAYCVFMTNDYSPETRLQAEDRLHRIGQTNKVTYYDLVCKSTVDVTVVATLRRKQRLSDLLTGTTFMQAVRGEEI